MRFAIGLLDYLFGEKVTLEVPGEGGELRRRKVTRRWLEQVERDGKMARAAGEVIRIHHLGLNGYHLEHHEVGANLPEELVQRFRDPTTKDMYAMSFLENGEPQTHFLMRDKWEAAKATLEEQGFV